MKKKVVCDEFPEWQNAMNQPRHVATKTHQKQKQKNTTKRATNDQVLTQNKFEILMETLSNDSDESDTGTQSDDDSSDEQMDQYSQTMSKFESRKEKHYISSLQVTPTHNPQNLENAAVDLSVSNNT